MLGRRQTKYREIWSDDTVRSGLLRRQCRNQELRRGEEEAISPHVPWATADFYCWAVSPASAALQDGEPCALLTAHMGASWGSGESEDPPGEALESDVPPLAGNG